MLIAEFAKTSKKIPLKILTWMARKNIIQNPLTVDDLIGLRYMEKIWGKREVLVSQLAKEKTNIRQRLIKHCDFDTKWERWAYTRMMNIPPEEKMKMKQIISEVELTFLHKLAPWQLKRLYQVREKAYKDKRKMANKTQTDIEQCSE